jgi:Asp-tRNA(Asn)/Glu-tRNA(Gln) amidotransferase A subunit family amidase
VDPIKRVRDATASAADVASGRRSPVDLVEESLQRIADLDRALNACTVVFADEARAAALAAERTVAKSVELGRLHGVPVVVKDEIWIAGAPSTLGSRALADFVPAEDAVAVERLRRAGAIVIAKTANPEYLWSDDCTRSELYGVTRNPWNPDRSPGASSGGSAAAVAAGMAPLAIGSDAGGSIRKPASRCGIAGLKPTYGLIPYAPAHGLWSSLGVVGPMARTVRDLALALSVLAGPDPRDALCLPHLGLDYPAAVEAGFDPRRVAWSLDLGIARVNQSVREVFGRAIGLLEGDGWNLEEAAPYLPDPLPIAVKLWLGELGPAPARIDLVEPSMRERFREAATISAHELYQAQRERRQYARHWEEFFCDYDVLVTPTVPVGTPSADPAPSTQSSIESSSFADPANLTGGPAVTVPMGLDDEGMPLGLQFMGPRFSDDRCLAAAARFETLVEPRTPVCGPKLTV